jgi:glycosyltransferase involved in cell wall biosynthesis
MRVGIDLSPLSYGNRARGIGTYAENLLAALAVQDTTNEYVLLTTSGTSDAYTPSFSLPPNFTLVKLASPRLGRATALVSHQLFLPWQVGGLKLDVLHTLAVPFNPSHPGVAFWQRVPTVVTCHDLMPLHMGDALLKHARYRRFYEFQWRATRRAAHVISVSECTARDLVQWAGIPREKITVIHHGVPAQEPGGEIYADVRALLQGAPFLLHVGGNEPQKNEDVVLRAFGLLCRNPAFRHDLVLVGKHHFSDDLALELTTRAALRIRRVSEVTRAELDALYLHCAALVFPSSYEGFGLPVVEAMRAGAPVITSNTSCLPEIAGEAALFVDPRDEQGLANAVRRVLDDERVRVKLSEAGERRAREFSWARAAEQTRAVYEKVARKE